MDIDPQQLSRAGLEHIKGRVPELKVGDAPLFASGGNLFLCAWSDDAPSKKNTICVCADLSQQLCYAQTFHGMFRTCCHLIKLYGEPVATKCAETHRGVVFVMTVEHKVLRFHSPLGLRLVVRRGDNPGTLRFDAKDDPSFWCEMLEPEGVDMVEGRVVLGDCVC